MTSIHQMTLRLPDDLARRLAAATPSRKRNQFVVDLVRRELDRESRELEEAALRLSSLEAAHASEDTEWLAFDNGPTVGDEFDEKRFLSELKARKEKVPKSSRVFTPA